MKVQLKIEGIFLKLKDVGRKGSVRLGPNLGYPSLIVFAVIPMVLVDYYCGVQNTYGKIVVLFWNSDGVSKVFLSDNP